MCGIAGYVGLREIDPARIERCLALMERRGPDAAAHRRWTNGAGRNVYLLNSRLSIVDLDERANQPFNVGRKWLTYNGELYNYVELREELAAAGHRFTTTSDTEVVLAALDRLGWEALDRFEGMWALAVYDEGDGSLTLARDRFGEKPLYLCREASGLAFGSEPKLVASLLGRRLEVNVDHLYRYLVNGYRALYKDGHTFFEELAELPPATLLRLSAAGEEASARYWKPRFAPDEDMSYEEAVAGARQRLFRSVELRLRADVPLAFCLSGGVDSTVLVSVAKKVCGYDVHGFTVRSDDPRYDERESVARSVAALGIRHTPVPLETGGFLDDLRTLVRYHDAPVYTITYFAHWRLMERIAAEGYRVSVSGTAADELFSGYYDHHLAYLYEVREDPVLHAASVERWRRDVRPLVRNPYLGTADLFLDNPDFRDHLFLDADRFAECLTVEWAEPFAERPFTGSLLRNRMLNELCHEVVPAILHEDDLNAMYFSIENRSPYLDRSLFEFCYRVPSRHLVREGRAKAVLRDAARGIAPDQVLDSPRKVGFNAPIHAFLDPRDPDVRSWLLGDGPIYEHVRREKIEELLDEPELRNSQSKFLFSFVNGKMFLEEFGER